MATGIISNAFYFTGWFGLSQILFFVNLIAYPLIIFVILTRLVRHTPALWKDLLDPKLVFSFFTIVAASDVLGIQLDLRGFASLAIALWLLALGLWFLLLYFSFAVLTFLNSAQNANVVHGGWLIAIVGTQSLVLLGVRVADHLSASGPGLIVLAHMLWGIGLALYAIFVTLFSYRIFFFRLAAEDLSPLLWVVMGAAAISANAGTSLILSKPHISFLADMKPFIDGTTMMIWAWGTWWIPLLVCFGIWKHVICRVPLSYTPALWSLVFPLGMYSVATFRFSLAAQFPFLQSLGRSFVWVAAAVWLCVMTALVVSNFRFFKNFAPQTARA
ncbi:MAG: tellurite resistance/C4-dicarboxylate transporter family protein [Proteobacteria bacterium]|nr:tellurite resistance/C4-dicarboxylate transporter family protein [Pseudomonadota bacterium]